MNSVLLLLCENFHEILPNDSKEYIDCSTFSRLGLSIHRLNIIDTGMAIAILS